MPGNENIPRNNDGFDGKALFCNLDRISSCLPNLMYGIGQGNINDF